MLCCPSKGRPFAIFDQENQRIRKYFYKEVVLLKEKWKQEFRERNRSDLKEKNGGVDRAYVEFCKSIDDYILHWESENRRNKKKNKKQDDES